MKLYPQFLKQLNLDLNKLDAREMYIVIKRNGLGDEPSTLQALGNELKLTRERVRQIEERAYEKMNVG